MDALFVPAADALGASVDQIKLIFCLLVSYPLGSVFIRVPGKTLKHVFSLSVALLYLIPILGLFTGFLQLLADVLATYFIAKTVKGPRMPWIVFWINMGHLTANHILRVVLGRENEPFDLTAPQMVLVMKLTTFAWNVYDGQRPDTDIDAWQSKMRVKEYPSLLAFLGYSFYFPGFLVGPYIEYAAYAALVDGSLFKIGTNGSPPSRTGRAIPDGRKRVAYARGALGLVFLVTFVVAHGSLNCAYMLQKWFLTKPFYYRILYLQLSQTIERTKYYGIWTLTEGAAILTGFGYTGVAADGKTTLWDGAANIIVRNVELAPNFKVLLDSWNMKTNVWLRECIYKRVTPKGKKPGFRSSMLTFATSAFWHGIAPGYYMSFILGGFIQTVGRLCRTYIRPLFLPLTSTSTNTKSTSKDPVPSTPLKRTYDIVGTIASVMMMNFVTAPFILLSARDSFEAWRRVDYYGLWAIFGTLFFFYAGGRVFLSGLQTQRVKKAAASAPVLSRTSSSDTVPAMPPVDDALREVEKKLR